MSGDDPVWLHLVEVYRPKLLDLAERVAADLRGAGETVWEPSDRTDDQDLAFGFVVRRPGVDPESELDDGDIDITLRLMDGACYDGEDHAVNFGLDVVEWGGLIVGNFIPFNYTGRVWVDARSDEAVADRWELFASSVLSADLADEIRRHRREQEQRAARG